MHYIINIQTRNNTEKNIYIIIIALTAHISITPVIQKCFVKFNVIHQKQRFLF